MQQFAPGALGEIRDPEQRQKGLSERIERIPQSMPYSINRLGGSLLSELNWCKRPVR